MNETGGAAARPDSTASAGVSLSLVIPAYNEGPRLDDGVARLRVAVAAGAIDPETTEFIVVDDGSSDDTTERAGALFSAFPHVRLLRLSENHGKGGAVRAGVTAATAPMIAFADADMAIDPGQTPQFMHALAAGRPGHRLASRLGGIGKPLQPPPLAHEPDLQPDSSMH